MGAQATQQHKKSDLDQLFDELPNVPRYVDNDSETVRSIRADMQRMSLSRPSTATATSEPATKAAQPIQLTKTPTRTETARPSAEAKYVVGVEAIDVAFAPSAPPGSPSLSRCTQYNYIPSGNLRLESVRPPLEYISPPPFFDQGRSPPYYDWAIGAPRSQPQPKEKKKSTCAIS
ncbi:uncharacterized protein LOC115561845 [Drosophila navojoa]|nr:uncharacterized protein LOC115561845 [Drosophila navojoa]